MSELETEYDNIDFNVIPAEETAQRGDEIATYGFTEKRHGLVAFDKHGKAVVKLPGHNFGRDEIIDAINAAQAAGGM